MRRGNLLRRLGGLSVVWALFSGWLLSGPGYVEADCGKSVLVS